MEKKRHHHPKRPQIVPPTPVFHPYPVQPILQPIAQIPLDSTFPFHQRMLNMIERPLYVPLREGIYRHL